MSNKTRKYLWPVSLAMSLALVGVLATFVALSAIGSTPVQAHDPCEGLTDINEIATCEGNEAASPHTHGDDDEDDVVVATGDMIVSDSNSPSGAPEFTVTIVDVSKDYAVGTAIVLYLEDDFQQPDSISTSSVYFVADMDKSVATGNGARVYPDIAPKIETGAYFDEDKKDVAIRVFIPDMCTDSAAAPSTSGANPCAGPNGPEMGQRLRMIVQDTSGIKNPSEAGTHSVSFDIVEPGESFPTATNVRGRNDDMRDAKTERTVGTVAKISLSDVDNKRGYEMTVTGSGFNDGTTASVYVLANAKYMHEAWWDGLMCGPMKVAMGYMADDTSMAAQQYCGFFNPTGTQAMLSADAAKAVNNAHLCARIINDGTKVGGALVGSDDKVAVTFEVTAPTFKPGNVNYICMADGEGRASNTDVEDFNLEPSIKVVPSSVSSGDTVNVFAQDYHNTNAGLSRVKIATTVVSATGSGIRPDGSGTATFRVPGGLEGVLRIDAMWGDTTGGGANGMMPNGKCDKGESACIEKNTKITIAGADLEVSKSDVRPNETVTINGNGFGTGTGTCIPFSNITLDNLAVKVHPDSKGCTVKDENGDDKDGVEVSNSGQFVATIILWPANGSGGTNPTLIPGTHELSVEDNKEFTASVNLTIAEPTITVGPDVAGPRDYITVMGENWPVDNLDNTLNKPTVICVEDFGEGDECNGRSYPVYADSVGRFQVEHRVHRRVAIPSTVQVKATYEDVAKIGSFAVPASTIEVTPAEGQPGDTVTLTAANMPVYNEVDYVEIGGTTYSDPGVNTDRDGNVTVEDVLIPGLDPGVYSVVINVQGTIAIGEINVLAESSAAGAPAELPGAVENLGDNLVAIFHFDDVGKSWSFYDPRPDFADLNTLTEMVNGEAYWILVSETVEDVVLNNKVRSLTCRGSDCWNLEVW